MFNLTHKIPKNTAINIAFSGGIDSLAMSLLYNKMNYDVTLLHFNHGCEYSNRIEMDCRELADNIGLPIVVGQNRSMPKPKQSLEDAWRRARYRFLYENTDDNGYVLTGHHIDDSIETWVWSSMHGEGKIIQPHQSIEFDEKTINLVRPLLMTNKEKLTEYVDRSGFTPVYDEFNDNNGLMRNYIRNVMMEHVLVINPGIEKVIRKKYIKLLQ